MLSKCFLILIFHFDLLIIQSWSQRSIPTTPAWGDKYPCWLLAAFGNLFMASFYCTPKEIGSLCILGKKNTPFKRSLLLRPPEHAMRAPQCLGTERLSVELASSSPAADLLSVWGIPAPGPNPQTSLWRPQHTHAFFCLDNDLPWRLTQNRERRKGEGEGFHLHSWLQELFIVKEDLKKKKVFPLAPRSIFNKGKQNRAPCSPWLLQ